MATRSTALAANGTTVVVLRLSARARRRIMRAGTVSAALSIRVVDAAGNATATTRTIVLR